MVANSAPTLANWIAGARPRTLPAAVVPVAVGAGVAAGAGDSFGDGVVWWRVAVALVVSLLLQVGVNYANDYSDGVRGTDLDRVGPMRLTASGAARPQHVLVAAIGALGLAGVLGLVLVALVGQWWLLAVGAAAIAAAWFYTGGRRPYGYLGLGELGVLVFFGFVATVGTTYTQALVVPWPAWVGATGVGLNACALLMANNLRDAPKDSLAGKRTLAVRLGERHARRLFALELLGALVLGAVCAVAAPWALLVLLLTLPVTLLSLTVLAGARGRLLLPVLAGTGLVALGYGVLLGIGLAL